jgi:predicted nucleotidyltransferase component of viral defense system
LALLNRVKARDIYDVNEIIKSNILELNEMLSLSKEAKNISTYQELIHFIANMQEKDDDEIVYLDEKFPVAVSFEELQKRLIENIGLLK